MQDIKSIANKIGQAGGRLYLVGGAVRDELLGKSTHDEDYCVTGISTEKFQELFPEAHIRGKAFAVFDIGGKEFAMARTESKQGIGHKEFEIKADPKITIEQDLARRDITINAIAKDVLTGEIIDPFKGQEDLKNKVIKATTEHFKEDPLRVYRVARFAAQLGFEVEKETINQMNQLKSELNCLSGERVFAELSKALDTDSPSIFFDVLRNADVLDIHFKEIKDLIGAEQPPKYHPEGDAYNHTMLVLDMAADLTKEFEQERKLEIRFSALVHDLGKGVTPKEQYPHHYGHENSGAELVGKFANKIKTPNNWIKCGKTACREHMRGGIFYKMKPSTKVEFVERVDKSLLGLDGLQIVVICDKTSGGRENNKDDISFEEIGKKCFNEINGQYIQNKYGLNPGIEFGNKLHEERIKWMKDYLKGE
ncbi:MAG: HD domain-containing protein [Clostridia bacterium]|nr:HD domain-containing protein [Clostridia bacterium]